jgi:hypothetical protein
MTIYVLLIKSPNCSVEVELCVSEIHAANVISEYQRCNLYDDYSFEICVKYIEDASLYE